MASTDDQDLSPGDLRAALEQRLKTLPKVTIGRWKDTQLICVFFAGKEIGHFHGQTILDLRLTPKIICDEGLSRNVSAEIHPKRSAKSCWIGVAFKNNADLDRLIHLVGRACNER